MYRVHSDFNDTVRVRTGFKKLDGKICLNKGELVVIAGRPAIGKTSFVCDIIKNTLIYQGCLFFTMQLKEHKKISDLIDYSLNNNGRFSVVKDIYDFDSVLLKAAEERIFCGLELVVIDNFSDFLNCSHYSENTLILKLKEMALKLGVCVVVISNTLTNKKFYSTYKDMECKGLIVHSDKILSIYRPDLTYDELECEINVIEENVAVVSLEKGIDSSWYGDVAFKFDNKERTFTEK